MLVRIKCGCNACGMHVTLDTKAEQKPMSAWEGNAGDIATCDSCHTRHVVLFSKTYGYPWLTRETQRVKGGL